MSDRTHIPEQPPIPFSLFDTEVSDSNRFNRLGDPLSQLHQHNAWDEKLGTSSVLESNKTTRCGRSPNQAPHVICDSDKDSNNHDNSARMDDPFPFVLCTPSEIRNKTSDRMTRRLPELDDDSFISSRCMLPQPKWSSFPRGLSECAPRLPSPGSFRADGNSPAGLGNTDWFQTSFGTVRLPETAPNTTNLQTPTFNTNRNNNLKSHLPRRSHSTSKHLPRKSSGRHSPTTNSASRRAISRALRRSFDCCRGSQVVEPPGVVIQVKVSVGSRLSSPCGSGPSFGNNMEDENKEPAPDSPRPFNKSEVVTPSSIIPFGQSCCSDEQPDNCIKSGGLPITALKLRKRSYFQDHSPSAKALPIGSGQQSAFRVPFFPTDSTTTAAAAVRAKEVEVQKDVIGLDTVTPGPAIISNQKALDIPDAPMPLSSGRIIDSPLPTHLYMPNFQAVMHQDSNNTSRGSPTPPMLPFRPDSQSIYRLGSFP